MELKELKEKYKKLEQQYKLPSFKNLNEDFEIEKIDRETETLLRMIRKTMMEKLINSLSFIEMLLNPMNAPRMYLLFIKSMTQEEKKTLDKIYLTLAKLSLISLECEIDYNEKKEADLIDKTYQTWATLKPSFKIIFQKINKPTTPSKKERNYFG